MTVKYLFRLVFLGSLYGCSNNSDYSNRTDDETRIDEIRIDEKISGLYIEHGLMGYHNKQFGLYIKNSPRRGMQYFDSSQEEYNYRNNTITIRNDSTVAIQLEIGFSEKGMNLKDSIRSKFFLLPRDLTYDERGFNAGGMSEELKRFLAFEIDKPVHLSKVLNPKEKCVLTFGVLTNTQYPDPTTPFQTELLTSQESSSAIFLKLKINDTLIIPCGQFSYIKK